ncbi:outer membrane protein assembly factor BamB family protein [Thermomonospora cellulosilytica]|uniref:Polyvinyl alcohol dehydrogenase (Cytochrome) n=1 Tax=Thermomonospora cellulosilytica TaxID=1411118 RepID=A0A7W3N113_9ACTN|nr:PQQ-binding-like beta-propeller repeat protein [Thermomonospora cellulosilytica]MBA9005509.1 polyvinyl alcohol dehydrogenase (cytochrome) [Thermomonospora cellulosilytica]
MLVLVAVLLAALAAAPGPAPATAATNPALGDWTAWNHDPRGSRHNPHERRITPKTVKNLKLAWAFVFPNHTGATASQPARVGDTLYVGGPDSRFYALDARTGATRWVFDLRPHAGEVAPPEGHLFAKNPVRDGPAVAGDKVFFGDSRGNIFALNRHTGRLAWMTEIDDHPNALITGSPVHHRGKVYVGVSSYEYSVAGDDSYPCCTFSGKMVALDARTGEIDWTYRTMPPVRRDGTWPNGTPKYAPSGGSVWSTPAIDARTDTIYFGTGNNYSGTEGRSDSIVALDLRTGRERWVRQMTHPDTWTVRCLIPLPPGGSCPGLGDELQDEMDHDVGSPLLFTSRGRTLVGITQKSGIYHVLDARTGEIVWQTQLSIPAHNEPWRGIEWGASYDGHQLYVATWRASPGTLFALDPDTGEINWRSPLPADACETGGAADPIEIDPPPDPARCILGNISAVTSTPGLVYEGGEDGKMRIYSARTGETLWVYDAVRMYTGVNGLSGPGGSISGNGGAVVSHGMLYVNAGYQLTMGIPGHVLLAFKP